MDAGAAWMLFAYWLNGQSLVEFVWKVLPLSALILARPMSLRLELHRRQQGSASPHQKVVQSETVLLEKQGGQHSRLAAWSAFVLRPSLLLDALWACGSLDWKRVWHPNLKPHQCLTEAPV